MPVNQELIRKLKQKYGNKKGEDVYYGLEQKMKKRGKTLLRGEKKDN